MKLMKKGHAVHQIGYHIIFCTKYRQPILTNTVEMECKKIIAECCIEYKWFLKTIEVMPDHVHIFIQADTSLAPYRIVQTIKSISAVHIFSTFPKIKGAKFWGSGLWSKSYYIGSVGNMSKSVVERYINNQKSSSSMETSSHSIPEDQS